MSYQKKIKEAKSLQSIDTDEDIIQLSHALFPGTHCPLFGALMAASYVQDLAVINIGTQECTFYGKDFSRLRQKGKDLVFSLVTHKNDLTFGMADRIKAAVEEVVRVHKPKALLLISTCVVELIGEDVGSIAKVLEADHEIPILFVKTEHFKCNSHMPGLKDTMSAMVHLMEKRERKPLSVNVLGHRFDDFHDTELFHLLKSQGVQVNMSIPSTCSVERLKQAGEAELNIVTDFTALALAESMQLKLDQPYVIFDKHLDPERVLRAYEKIGESLNLSWSDEISKLYESCREKIKITKKQVEGQTFIYGNTPMKALEMVHFLATLGMKPQWVQLREWYEDDEIWRSQIIEMGHNPRVSRIANIIPMREVYDEVKPSLYVGHENPMELMKRGIRQLTFDREASQLGFQLCLSILDRLTEKGRH